MPTTTYDIVSVANITALKTLDGNISGTAPLVYTQCYSTLSDSTLSGGGALAYVWNSSDMRTRDNVTIIEPNDMPISGRWNAILDTISARDAGAVGDGSTDDTSALSAGLAASESTGIPFTIGPTLDSYVNNSTLRWTGGDGAVRIDPSAVFSGTGGPPVLTTLSGLGVSGSGLDFVRKTFGDDATTWNTGNLFVFCRAGVNEVTTSNLVVIQGTATINAAGASAWAGEFSVFANEGATEGGLTGIEIISMNNADSTTVINGLLVVADGSAVSSDAVFIKGRNANAYWTNGIYFDNGDVAALSGAILQSVDSVCEYGIFLTGSFSTAQLSLPSFVVGPTITSQINYLEVSGATSGNAPILSAQGSNLNIGITLQPKANGYVDLGSNASFGTFVSDTTASISGYITIKDFGGTARHLAVVG